MKKIFTLFLIIVAITLVCFGAKKIVKKIQYNNYVEKVKKGWYVEILNDFIYVREEPYRYSHSTTKVYKGEVYEVLKNDLNDPNLYWYLIKFRDGSTGWIANTTSGTYLKDYNNSQDIAIPIIKFKDDEYHVVNIKDINYDHLTVWDDRDDYKITHIVYHEVDESKNIDQYWIKYTITDASGKYSSKTQKIIFENLPSEDEVVSFTEYTRD